MTSAFPRWLTVLAGGTVAASVVGGLVFGRVVWPALFWPLYALIVVTLLTWPWRALRLRLVALAFLAGAGPVMGLALLVQRGLLAAAQVLPGLARWVERNLLLWGGDFGAGFVAPVTEETVKMLPVVLFLWWLCRRRAPVFGPLDVAILGVAVGAGFDFTETLFHTAAAGGAPLGLEWDYHVGPRWGVLHLFPTLTTDIWGEKLCYGHAGWTGTVAIALGLAFWLGRRRPWTRLLPWLAGLWAMWDHYLWNAFGGPAQGLEGSWLASLPALDGHGLVMPYAMLLALAFGALLSARAIRRYLAADPVLAVSLTAGLPRGVTWSRPGLGSWLGRWRDLLAFVHARRALAYGLRVYADSGRPGGLGGEAAQVLAVLRAGCLASAERLTLPGCGPRAVASAGQGGVRS